MAIEPKTKADQEKMGVALAKLAKEDPSFRVRPIRSPARPFSRAWASCISTSRSTACARVQGRGQCRQAAGGLPRDHHASASKSEGKFKRSPAVRGQFGHVWLVVEPKSPGKGYEFVKASSAVRCRRNTSPASKRASKRDGFRRARGLPGRRRQGHAVRRLVSRRRLVEMAFKIAGSRLPRRLPQGQAGPARADHEGRSGDAGRLRRSSAI
jgi:translation elongation factor EF-G